MRRMTSFLPFAGAVVLLAACEHEAGIVTDSGQPYTDRTVSAAAALSRARGHAGPAGGDAAAPSLTPRAYAPEKLAAPERESAPPSSVASSVQAQEPLPGSMLIRQGNASVQVDSLEIAVARLRDVARRVGGMIANTTMRGGKDELREASIELRIPSERFDDAVTGLTPLGKVESVNVSVADVGEEYVDISARVANARRLEQRLIELLEKRTGRLADVLSVERELARVREEIERYEGRLRYLRTRVLVSTLTVNVHEPLPLVASRPGENPIRDAFKQAWRNFVAFVAGTIAVAGLLIPLAVLVVLGVFAWRRYGANLKSAGASSA